MVADHRLVIRLRISHLYGGGLGVAPAS
jgi:hypothetical protein